LTIVTQATVPPEMLKAFQCAVKECDKKPLTKKEQQEVAAAGGKRCAKLGEIKHACVDEKMSKDPNCRTERTYDMKQRPPRVVRDASGAETSGYHAAKAAIVAAGLPLTKGRFKRPDAIFGKKAPYHVFDAKFPCSAKVKSGTVDAVNLSAAGKSGGPMMSKWQRRNYQKIADGSSKTKGTVTPVSPADAVGVKC